MSAIDNLSLSKHIYSHQAGFPCQLLLSLFRMPAMRRGRRCRFTVTSLDQIRHNSHITRYLSLGMPSNCHSLSCRYRAWLRHINDLHLYVELHKKNILNNTFSNNIAIMYRLFKIYYYIISIKSNIDIHS